MQACNSIGVCMSVCTCVCVRVSVCMCTYVCLYICVCVQMHARTQFICVGLHLGDDSRGTKRFYVRRHGLKICVCTVVVIGVSENSAYN